MRGAHHTNQRSLAACERCFLCTGAGTKTPWKKLMGAGEFVQTRDVGGRTVVEVKPEALTCLAENALKDVSHLLRPAHLQQVGA